MHYKCNILIVDDDENDIFFAKRAFTEINVHCTFQVLKNGQEAVDYLAGQGPYADRQKFPLPMMILLDINMPIMDGFQVLEWLRKRPGIKVIPTLVFSSSDVPSDITRAYELGANSFMTKSVTYDGLLLKLQTLSQYWLEHCKHPHVGESDGCNSAVA
ncbi:MAG TPA: response regulator [Verrucomicrobiae bacterium]|jgi:CheY-like chemotaxis protein